MRNWKRFLLVVVGFCVLLVVVSGCQSSKKKSSLQRIKENGKIVVGTGSGYYPFHMTTKNGELIGYDIDFANALAKELGVKVEFQNFPFSGIIPALQANKIDIAIFAMSITDKRKEVVDFSEPYFISGQALLVNKNYPNVENLQDLDKAGNVIAVAMGTTGDSTATKTFKKATIKKFDNAAMSGLELLNGNATAIISDLPWIAIYHKLYPEKSYAILQPVTTEDLGVSVPKGNPELLAAINKFTLKYKASAEYKKSYNYWFVEMPWWDMVPPKK